MSILDAFRNILVELNKVQAPSLLLDDFIYLFNKGVQEYVNERYNLFETKLQLTDDLRVLIKSCLIYDNNDPNKPQGAPVFKYQATGTFGTSHKTELPSDYVHLLNCTCQFVDLKPKCEGCGTIIQAANKLNTNQWARVTNNYYLKPSIKNPYYYIVNIDNPTADSVGAVSEEVKKQAGGNIRYGNSVQPTMLVKFGNDPRYKLKYIYVDYLRAPIYYSISQAELDSPTDTTQIIEFPDYVTYEIINRIVRLIMENGSNPRLQTHTAANQSIA